MKNILVYIKETLKINSKSKVNNYNYHPKTSNELRDLIKKLVKERGYNADINDIDTSKIENMSYLFFYSDFNGNVSQWDVSKVKDMHGMFAGSKFDGNISDWDVSNVTDMEAMFAASPLEKNPPKWYKK